MHRLTKSKLLAQSLAVVGVFLLLFQVCVLIPLVWSRAHVARDLGCYYVAAGRILHHAGPYQIPPGFVPSITPRWYMYSPQLALTFIPVAKVPFMTVARAWYLVELSAFWLFAAILARIASSKWSIAGALRWGVALWTVPDMGTIIIAENIDAVLWVLFGLGFLLPARGVLWSAIAQVKPFTVPALILASVIERRAVWLPSLLVVGIGWGAVVAVCGPGVVEDWLRSVSDVASQGTANVSNISLSFACVRIAAMLGYIDFNHPLPQAARHFMLGAELIAIAVTAMCTRKMERDFRYASLTAAMLLFSPLCWVNYIPLLFLLPAVAIRNGLPTAIWPQVSPHPVAARTPLVDEPVMHAGDQ